MSTQHRPKADRNRAYARESGMSATPPPPSPPAATCGDPSWHESVWRARAITFDTFFLLAFVLVFYVLWRLKPLDVWQPFTSLALFLLALTFEALMVSSLVSTFCSLTPCYGANCFTPGCVGYDAQSWIWIIVFSVFTPLYIGLRYFRLVPGLFSLERPLSLQRYDDFETDVDDGGRIYAEIFNARLPGLFLPDARLRV